MTRVIRTMTRMLIGVLHCVATVTVLGMKRVIAIGDRRRYSIFSEFHLTYRHTITEVT